jgi:hypothetical protein
LSCHYEHLGLYLIFQGRSYYLLELFVQRNCIYCLQPICMTLLSGVPAIPFGGAKGNKEPTAKWTIVA